MLLVLVFFNVTTEVAATPSDILWIRLSTYVSYSTKPGISSCEELSLFPFTVWFSAEMENEKMTRAALNRKVSGLLVEHIEFSPNELSGLELYKDPEGGLWLSHLPLSERLMLWLVEQYFQKLSPLKTVKPSALGFEFDTHLLGEVFPRSDSKCLAFLGTTSASAPYEAHIKFAQWQLGF